MNVGLDCDHASIEYYDSDYPSPDGVYPENFDAVTPTQGLAFDLERYQEIASTTSGPILEPCCGTGRVALHLLRHGHEVTGVDMSVPLLDQFREKVSAESPELFQRCHLIESDVRELHLEQRFELAIVAFNSLLCIPSFAGQLAVLQVLRNHLQDTGTLVLDLVNPLRLKLHGDPIPKPFFTRRNVKTGNTYTRFAACDPIDAEQKQRLHGWYDEVDSEGVVKRRPYSMHWRPIFRYEVELMLRQTGFDIEQVEGGHQREPFEASSPRMFIIARATSS